jgi:hypothetical protein
MHVQHWYKDMRHSTKVKDAEGQPAFALINRATGLAIKHSLGQSHPVSVPPPARPSLSALSQAVRTCCIARPQTQHTHAYVCR